MNKIDHPKTAHWYVIHTHSKQEDRAAGNLNVLKVLVFNPKRRETRYNQYNNTPTSLINPLFPRYIFAKFKVHDELYYKIRFTRGVYAVVGFSEGPAPIDEEIIYLIQSRIGEDGFVKINDDLSPGDKVVIKDGPLRNFAGVFEREVKDADRIRILLETVSFQAHLEVERGMVRKTG